MCEVVKFPGFLPLSHQGKYGSGRESAKGNKTVPDPTGKRRSRLSGEDVAGECVYAEYEVLAWH